MPHSCASSDSISSNMYKATRLPMPQASQATNTRAAGATKNPAVTTSTADSPELKQKMHISSGRHQGAVHIPETICSSGQQAFAASRRKMPMMRAANQAATQATGNNIHLSAFIICVNEKGLLVIGSFLGIW